MSSDFYTLSDDDEGFFDLDLDHEGYFDLKSFFHAEELPYLIRSNGDQVSISDLDGKTVSLFFAHKCSWTCQWFTQELIEVYNELSSKGEQFEVILVAWEGYYSYSFDEFFSSMPWLAIPSTEPEVQIKLQRPFKVKSRKFPRLIVLDESGEILTYEGVEAVRYYESKAYPFTAEKLMQLKEKEPPLQCMLGTASRDFLISSDGRRVPISELEGSIIGLFFYTNGSHRDGSIPFLKEARKELKQRGEKFEIVLVPSDDEDGSYFELGFKDMPWLAIPPKDKTCKRLEWQMRPAVSSLSVIDSKAKTLNRDAIDLVKGYGSAAYPFSLSPEKVEELDQKRKENVKSLTLEPLLISDERDYLIGKCSNQVKISNLEGKIVVLFLFNAYWLPLEETDRDLIDIYNELLSEDAGFEVVFVSTDEDEHSFDICFSKMPWLAIPFYDSKTRYNIQKLFRARWVTAMPYLVVFDRSGKFLCEHDSWVWNRSAIYQFMTEKMIDQVEGEKSKEEDFKQEQTLQDLKEDYKQEQTLQGLLVATNQEILISSKGNKIHISELQGKIVFLYFMHREWYHNEFIKILIDMDGKLRERGEKFEVVLAYEDDESASSASHPAFSDLPWLAIPFKSKCSTKRLLNHFKIYGGLVVIGTDGKTLSTTPEELIEKHGDDAYPFSPEKMEELLQKDKVQMKLEANTARMTPESLLVSWQRDYLIDKHGNKIPVSHLVGKTILLYFWDNNGVTWPFHDKLVEAYQRLKENGNSFEVIFVSDACDIEKFTNSLSTMPWLALPFGDLRRDFLLREFKFESQPPFLVAITPGHAITSGERLFELFTLYGDEAYPFTKQKLRELEARRMELDAPTEQMATMWPEKVTHALHQNHELVRTHQRRYSCSKCLNDGFSDWIFTCYKCKFSLDTKCAFEVGDEDGDQNSVEITDL